MEGDGIAIAFGWNQNTLTALYMGIVMLGTLKKPPLGTTLTAFYVIVLPPLQTTLTAFYVEIVILILPPLQTTLTAFYVEIVMLSLL